VADLEVAITRRVGLERASLTPTETKLLRQLMVNAGQVVSKRDLQASIWGDGATDGDSQAIAVYIRRLRRKLEVDAAQSTPDRAGLGGGYRFSAAG
jgi:DNA-binding response OmpR family regulator